MGNREQNALHHGKLIKSQRHIPVPILFLVFFVPFYFQVYWVERVTLQCL